MGLHRDQCQLWGPEMAVQGWLPLQSGNAPVSSSPPPALVETCDSHSMALGKSSPSGSQRLWLAGGHAYDTPWG